VKSRRTVPDLIGVRVKCADTSKKDENGRIR
jgi:hypothetical protein